jgi:hypothetical protein
MIGTGESANGGDADASSSSTEQTIFVVSGLPRSGTSLAMQMLSDGGMEAFTDGVRQADEDNPRGYFEHELTKSLIDSSVSKAWLASARGKVVKIISFLLPHLPIQYSYKVVFVERVLEEVLQSQSKMLKRRSEPDVAPPDVIAGAWRDHLKEIDVLLEARSDIEVLRVSHRRLIEAPDLELARIIHFTGRRLDFDRMRAAIHPTLFRNRGDA